MQNLFTRAISGLVYTTLVLFSCFSGGYGYLFLAGFLGASAIIEWMQFRKEKHISLPSALMTGILFLSIYCYSSAFDISPQKESLLHFLIVFLFFVLLISQVFIKHAKVPQKLFHVVFGLIYISFPLFLLPRIPHALGGDEPWLLASIFILIWTSDTFAYLIGRSFGKHKLLERISPNKTWEGFLGGVVFTMLAAFILSRYTDILPVQYWLVMAALDIVFGTVGDLFESAIKRGFDMKDSGRFLPGHGGILDRIDSLLFALPVTYFYLRILDITL
ncbi:MAG TPA: phosphatidate cytidylyltransferase [Cryomorphaceae bacterium]|nr:phosphatidate cytidylyltransferase [Cryomorphaceae bacterium]